MKFIETPLKGAYLIDLEKKEHDRGFFARYYCSREFEAHGLSINWVQVNNSFNKEVSTLRGLHFQSAPFQEDKLIRCVNGAIWDVIVDIRTESQTFGKWFGAELNAENRTMMYAPKGFAHGFITLLPDSEVIYLVSDYYNSQADNGLIWNDKTVNINWPIEPRVISEKDKNAKELNQIKL
jgi:dTDP-4-dehydrorhamnose 3,5-epimerase